MQIEITYHDLNDNAVTHRVDQDVNLCHFKSAHDQGANWSAVQPQDGKLYAFVELIRQTFLDLEPFMGNTHDAQMVRAVLDGMHSRLGCNRVVMGQRIKREEDAIEMVPVTIMVPKGKKVRLGFES